MHGGSGSNGYRGVDRRQRLQGRRSHIRRTEVLGLVAVVLALGVLLPLGLASIPPGSRPHTHAFLRTLSSIFFVCAGVLHLVRARVNGDTRSGLRGGGTLALGVLSAPTTALAPLLNPSLDANTSAPMIRAVAVVACISLLARATHAPAVDTAVRPLWLTTKTIAASLIFIGCVALAAQSTRELDGSRPDWVGIECAMAAGWALCAVGAGRLGRAERDVSFTWLAIAAGLMAGDELLRALSLLSGSELQYYATGLQLAVGVVALTNAGTDLSGLLSAASNQMFTLSGVVRDTERQLRADDKAEATRRHDARSILTSLKAASVILDRYDATLDDAARSELLGTFDGELRRLEHMVERRGQAALETFRLDELLIPVLSTLDNVHIRTDLEPVRVRGRAAELAGLVQDLVTQLGRRSGDGLVWVHLGRSTGGVQLICDIAGERVAPSQSPDLASARALRLQVARHVMREQEGDVVMHERQDGTTSLVLWLRPAEAGSEGSDLRVREIGVLAASSLLRDTDPSGSARGVRRYDPRAAG